MKPAARMRPQRAALSLYAVLLVLPTLVLGFLQWHHIRREKQTELDEVPRDAEDAALRFRKVIQEELDRLVASEGPRPLEHYAPYYSPDTPDGAFALLDSPLTQIARPHELLGWFAIDLTEPGDGTPQVFLGGGEHPAGLEQSLQLAALELSRRFFDNLWMRRSMPIARNSEELALSVRVLAASAASADDADCLSAQQMSIYEPVQTVLGDFELLFYREGDGTPRLVAHRHVLVEQNLELVGRPECLQRLAKGRRLVQGFFLDPQWFFGTLPESVAATVLTKRERFLREGESCCGDGREYMAEVNLVGDLGFETESDADARWGRVRIAIDTADVDARYRERAWRFFGLAAMLALALTTGVVLLGRSVQKDLEQAARTENFVAAVTHELRTPLSAIKLHGEMLLDGWVKDPAKQEEYYRRIVRETGRLSTLVERVLEKARLSAGPPPPQPGDLAAEVARHVDKLHGWRAGDEPDLEFELPEGLPEVLLTPEAVASILVNLVENARKYAPFDPARPGSEPIRVAIRRSGSGLSLEVADRGPGVPESERARIFEAFYRVGNEATRTARGTGLGLHLVALHAASVGGRAEVLPREGGGAIFRVTFPFAPHSAHG